MTLVEHTIVLWGKQIIFGYFKMIITELYKLKFRYVNQKINYTCAIPRDTSFNERLFNLLPRSNRCGTIIAQHISDI